MLSLRALIQEGMGSLNPQCRVYLKTYILQNLQDEKGKGKGVSSKIWIMGMSNVIQNYLVDIELVAREYGMNKLSR